jgi:hypothetical protein
MRNAIYTFGKEYTGWGAVFPGNFVPVLTFEGKSCSLSRVFTRFHGKVPSYKCILFLGEGIPP